MAACTQADDSAPAVTPQASLSVTSTPIPTLQPTATPPAGITTGVLGGVSAAFGVSVYSDNCCRDNGWWGTSSAGDISIDVLTDSGELDVTSKTQRIIGFWITPAGSVTGPPPSWDVKTAAAVCQQYLPPDAIYRRTASVTDNVDTYPVRIYASALLARSVIPADFLDASGKVQPPGTIYEYLFPDGGTLMGPGGCRLSTDELYALEGYSWRQSQFKVSK